jgi:hypothetical protein
MPWFICVFDCSLFACFFLLILRRNCEQHITSSNSHMVWSGVEIFDGKLLVLRSIRETFILRDFSETAEHGCSNQREIIPVLRRWIFFSWSSYWQKKGEIKVNKKKKTSPSNATLLVLEYFQANIIIMQSWIFYLMLLWRRIVLFRVQL